MKGNYLNQIIIIITLFLHAISLDNSTLSNYKDITITNLTGIFTPDFEKKIVTGDLNFTLHSNVKGSKIIFDSYYLEISSVTDEKQNKINFTQGETDENLGTPLIMNYEYESNTNITINIKYSTTENGASAQFLSEEQTIGKKHPYFFTMSEMILGRQLLPSQDTPAVKFPFYLGITVKNGLRGMISGLFDKKEDKQDSTTFFYYQKIPVPTYLIALVAGNIVEKEITENISVYTEPEFIEEVYKELIDLPEILNNATSYMGEYEWGKYNVLVLPNSFPYSGMENPCLSFCSPCLINGDKSLVDIVAHELIHSWSGNLVTNENWRDFWLNEGITMFLQRKIVGMWRGVDYSKMDGILGWSYIDLYLKQFGENSTYTTLRPNLTGVSPDDFYSDIPYEKGYNFIYYIESLIGEENMKKFFQNYFAYFKYKSIDLYDFQNYFIEFCKNNSIDDETLNKIDWNAWIFQPGKCPVKNDLSNIYQKEVDQGFEKFKKEELDQDLENLFKSWMHTSKTVFLNYLDQIDGFLSDKQHDFLTRRLKLYEKQDFLVSTNYFRIILQKTDKFYENELESLIKYLSSYGALDYMVGIYESFYKRDEVKAEETLNNLKSFYHSTMYKMAEEEINNAKESFPILTIDLEDKDKCLLLSNLNSSKLNIISNEYKKELDNLEISEGINLEFDKEKIGVKCLINSNEKYCLLNETITKSGEYLLKIPNRIQKQDYAIKLHESKIKIYTKETNIDTNLTKQSFNIDYNEKDINDIDIHFIGEPDEKVSIMNGNNEIKCRLNNSTIKCEIKNDILTIDSEKPKEYKKYELKVYDICGNEKYSFNVNVKNSKENSNSNSNFVIILIISIVGILVLIFVLFLIFRVVNKKNKSSDIDEINEEGKILIEN